MATTSQTVRAFPYPLLEPGNLSFPDGEYAPELQVLGDGSVSIEHNLSGVPLIQYMLDERQAVQACVFSVPITGYRRLFISDSAGSSQTIKWDNDWVGEPPFLHPLILCSETVTHKLKESDGVHQTWAGQTLIFEKGAKIALGPHYRLVSSLQSLLSIDLDEQLSSGQIKVMECSEGGFTFKVGVAQDLHAFLKNNQKQGGKHYHQCRSIYTHAVSSCFSLLHRSYKEEGDWAYYRNLQSLAEEMERQGLGTWSDDNFCAEEAATKIYRHVVPPEEDDGQDV